MKKFLLVGLSAALFAAGAWAQAQQQSPAGKQPPNAKKTGVAPGTGQRQIEFPPDLVTGAVRGQKQIIYPPEFRADAPFSPGVRVAGMLFVAGQLGTDLKTGRLADTFEGEVRQSLDNIGVILKAAGMDYANVVSVTVYVTDLTKFADLNKVYTEYFKANRPARATVQVAGLVSGAHVEISVIAHE